MEIWKKIKCLALDVDGVLTDGNIIMIGPNEWSRSYYIRDGMGLVLLKQKGYKLAIITSSTSDDIRLRAQNLGIDYFFEGQKNKADAFAQLLKKSGLKSDEVAYIGDDIIDLPIFNLCGISIAPADAHPEVLNNAKLVTKNLGGRGAVHEICDQILTKGPM